MTVVDGQTALVIRCEARGFPFDVHGETELHGLLAELFAPLERSAGDAQAVFSIGRDGDGTLWNVRMDGQYMMGCEQRGQALHGLVVFVNQRVWMARDDVLSIHAAAVATAHGAVMLPAASGSGKTTLCARLLQRGAAYLSDDSVALDRDGRILGYPKPLGFKGATREQFAETRPADDAPGGRPPSVWQVAPGRLGAASVTSADPVVVVVPRFEAGAPLQVEPMSRAAGAAALLGQVQNLPAFGFQAALETIGRLVAQVPCHSVVHSDAREAAAAVLDLVRPVEGPGASYQVVAAQQATRTGSAPFPAGDMLTLSFEDGALLVRGDSGEFITVDRVGATVWSLLDGHRTVDSIAAELAPLFGAPPRQIASDLSDWTRDLVARGFLVFPSDITATGESAAPR